MSDAGPTSPTAAIDAHEDLWEARLVRAREFERLGQWGEARAEYLTALSEATAREGTRLQVDLLRWVARTYQEAAEFTEALAFLARAEGVARHYGERSGLGHCLNLRAIISWQRGDLDEASHFYAQALDLARETNDLHLAALAAQNLGVVASVRGAHEEARQYYEVSLAACRARGALREICTTQNNLGRLHTETRDWDAAETAFAEAEDLALQVADHSVHAIIVLNHAEMCVRKGDVAAAEAACARVMMDGGSVTGATAHGYRVQGLIALAAGDAVQAERSFADAERYAVQRGDQLLRAQLARDRAELYRGQGRTRDLLLALNTARRLYSEIRVPQAITEVLGMTERLEREVLEVVRRWSESIEEKDQYTRGHCDRVAELACAIARRVGVEADQMFWFRVGALLHDVGKVVISSDILNKRDKLTADEWAVMKLHARAGADILAELDFPYDVVPCVRSHHENWDGSGYPDGLRAEEIPLWARIVTLADVYDALTTERSYKQPLSSEAALEVMRRDVGRQFDPALFDACIAAVGEVVTHTLSAPAQRRSALNVGAVERDDLTGLLLRKAVLVQAQECLAEARTRGEALSLLVIDVDHFKLVNDTFGHLQGDDVLRAVAAEMRDAVGERGILGRYAGDEFVLLLPGTEHEVARAIAADLCASVATVRLAIRERREGTVGVTLSIGVATSDASTGEMESLFAAADRALYVAKRRGRNQAASATEADEERQVAALHFDRFVGRTREMRLLLQELESACGGSPRLACVVGEAGIGKTSLVRQLQPEVRLRGGLMVSGRCLATDVKPPYGPWAEIVQAIHAAHLVPPDARWPELARLVPALGAGQEPSLSPGSKYALLAELSAYLRQACHRVPLTLVVDDVQWADASTWDALEYVRHHLEAERLLICMTLRAEDASRVTERRRHLSRDERFRDVTLHRLAEDDLRTWLETILHQGEIEPSFLRFVHRYTEGNPLLVVHVLRSLQEAGALWYAGRRWQWRDRPDLELPTAVTDLIDARIERLGERARAHLTVAAVVGRSFDLETVLVAGGMDEDELLDALTEGTVAHVVEEVGDPAEEHYAFSHGLIADAIKARVPRRRLARMHGQVATALERLRPDAIAVIAAHYDAAGTRDKAHAFAVRAAERAVSVYAHDEAAASYALAERNAPDVQALKACRFQRLHSLELAGAYEAAESLCDLLLAEAATAGDSDPLFSVRRARERIRGLRGQSLAQTAEAVHVLLAQVTAAGVWHEQVELLGMLSRILLRRGEQQEARRLGNESVAVAEAHGSRALLATTLMHLGSAVIEVDSTEALQCYERALATFTEMGDLVGQARASINLGIALSRRGDDARSQQVYESGLALSRRIHSPDLTGLAALNLGVLQMKRGAFAEADASLGEAMEGFAVLHNEPHRLAALYNQANLALETNNAERAARLYGDAAVAAAAMNQLDVEVGARAGQGLAWLALGRADDARGCLQACHLHLRAQSDWWFQGRQLLEALAVRLAVLQGDRHAAAVRFQEGLQRAELSDAYGLAWLVADVTGPLDDLGVPDGWPHVARLAAWVEASDYASLTARYRQLNARAAAGAEP
ncbi:MAG: diguanylate cyclase [Gemmatimonadetes bacterium]|nr:diguanylate cyclase [Gemmatimonadota bacterium]